MMPQGGEIKGVLYAVPTNAPERYVDTGWARFRIRFLELRRTSRLADPACSFLIARPIRLLTCMAGC
jgi:hypothetical protein